MIVKLVRLYEFFLAEKVVNKTMLDLHVANALSHVNSKATKGGRRVIARRIAKGWSRITV